MYDRKPWLKSYDSHVGAEADILDFLLTERFDWIASQFPDNPAIHFLGVTLTYRQLLDHANRFAQALRHLGCGAGDIVGINLPNIPQSLIAYLGTLKAGCAASGVSPLLTPRELAYQLNDSAAKVLVTLDAIFEQRILSVSDQLPHLEHIVVTGVIDFLPWIKRTIGKLLKKVPTGQVKPVPGKRVVTFSELLKKHPASAPNVDIQPGDTCLVMYTGGTTGLSKGSVLTHQSMVTEIHAITKWLKMEAGREVILSGFPFFHIAGLALGFGSMFMGCVQILTPNPRDTKHMVKEMARFEPSMLVNVPSLYMMLLEQPDFQRLDFSNLRFCLSAASPFPSEAIGQLESVVGGGKILEAYGMTEVSSLLTMNPLESKRKMGTVGIPLPGTHIRLMDLETGSHDVPAGAEGEIVAKGPQIMKCYLNKPGETAFALREHDGEVWLHTGDVARMDEDGFFTIVDRTKDMLNVGGYKVFSREVEEKLYEHPAIELCAIIGVANHKRPGSDVVKLVAQLSPAFREKDPCQVEAEIAAFARENFAPYKVPKVIEFVDAIPLTPVGKVDKKALRT